MPCPVEQVLEMIGPMRCLIVLLLVAQRLPLALAEEKPAVIGDWLEVARENFETENLAGVNDAIDRFEQTHKPTAESLDLRGSVLMEEGKFGEAAKAFEAARQADPVLFAPRIHAGDVLVRQKKFPEARRVYEAALKETNIPTLAERLRYGILITCLAEHNENGARDALQAIAFPTGTPAYYYAQAAWAFAHGNNAEAGKWIKTAEQISPAVINSWFARLLFELGWIKKKPALRRSESI
jgi:tetratricopeptide (TPR) repeat protein